MASKFTYSMTGVIFVSAVAIGVHSAYAQSTNQTTTMGATAFPQGAVPAASSSQGVVSGSPQTAPPAAGQSQAVVAPPSPVVFSGSPDPTMKPTSNFNNNVSVPQTNGTSQPVTTVAPPGQPFIPSLRQAGGGPRMGGSTSNPPPAATFVPSKVETFQATQGLQIKHKSAILHTSLGDLTIHLFANEAPLTVANFMSLAAGQKEFTDVKTSKKVFRPFYNGLIFHRVVKDFLIQTGCPFGNGRGDPGYSLRDEISPTLKFDRPGLVAMALEQASKPGAYQKDSNGSQFFITLSPQPTLDGNFTIFGEVTEGMDVVKKIANVRVGPTDRPIKKVYLYAVDVIDPDIPPQQQQSAPIVPPVAMPVPDTGPAPASLPMPTPLPQVPLPPPRPQDQRPNVIALPPAPLTPPAPPGILHSAPNHPSPQMPTMPGH